MPAIDALSESAKPLTDVLSEAKLASCHPELIHRVRAGGAYLAAEGQYFRIAQGNRSMQQQAGDYNQGRSIPGKIITNARAGYSWHQFGMAVDCYPFCQGASGNLDWNASDSRFQNMVSVLRMAGLAWGGEWHSIQDPPHFQLHELPVTPTDADRAAYAKGGLAAVWKNYEKVLGPATVNLQASAHVPDAHTLSTIWHTAAGAVATIASRNFWRELRHYLRVIGHRTRQAHAVLTGRAESWDNTPPGEAPTGEPDTMNAENLQSTAAAVALPFTGLSVTEIRTFLHTHQREIRMAPVTDEALSDTRVDLLFTTNDPQLIEELTLGRTFGEYGQPVDLQASGDDTVDLQASAASAVLDGLKHFGKNIARAVGFTVTEGEKSAAEQAVIAFVGKDGLALAEDAVVYVNAKLGLGGVGARDAAVTKFKEDAEAAKKDLSHMASAAFNFVIEAALQIALSKGTVLLAEAAAAVVTKA